MMQKVFDGRFSNKKGPLPLSHISYIYTYEYVYIHMHVLSFQSLPQDMEGCEWHGREDGMGEGGERAVEREGGVKGGPFVILISMIT